jgi:periplasmic protein TonB
MMATAAGPLYLLAIDPPKARFLQLGIGVSLALHAIAAAAMFLGIVQFSSQRSVPSTSNAIEVMPVISMPRPIPIQEPVQQTSPHVIEKPKVKIPPTPKIHSEEHVTLVEDKEKPTPQNAAAALETPTVVQSAEEKKIAAAPTVGTPTVQALTPEQSWMGLVGAALERMKRYPYSAMHAGLQDTVFVHIVVSRIGKVLSASIVSSRHIPALDDATLDLIHRCSPLPPPPESLKGDVVAVDGSINYFLMSNN